MLEAHYNTLKPLELQSKKAYYDVGEAKPDVYFESRVVWEVRWPLSRNQRHIACAGPED